MKKLLFLILGLLPGIIVYSADDIVFHSDFPKLPDSTHYSKNDFGRVRCYGETLRLKSSNDRFHPSATFKNIFSDVPYEISFDMRYRPDTELCLTGGHWGVIVDGEKEKVQAFVYSDKNTGIHVRTSFVGEKQYQNMLYMAKMQFSDAEESPFHKFKFSVRKNTMTLEIDGQFICTRNVSLAGTKSMTFYAYRCSAEVKNIQIKRLEDVAATAGQKTPVIYGAFDDDGTLQCDGKPLKAQGIQVPKFTAGLKGKAIDLSSLNSNLQYKLPEKSMTAGTISFWFSPKSFEAVCEDGERHHPFLELTGPERQGISIGLNHSFGISVFDKGGKRVGGLGRWSRDTCRKGDWVHLAITYSLEGEFQLYINSLPYYRGFYSRYEPDNAFLNNSGLDKISKLVFSDEAGIAMDELKIYNRALNLEEIVREYRTYMPVDMTVMHANLDSSKDEVISLQIGPAGYYMRPNPTRKAPIPAKIKLKAELINKKTGAKLAGKTENLDVGKPLDVAFEAAKYPAGVYHLVCTVNDKYIRSFDITSFDISEAITATTDELPKGKLIFEKKFSTPNDKTILMDSPVTVGKLNGVDYIEAASGKCDRFSAEVNFGKDFKKGRPYILEIDWPDDKPRTSAFYMHIKASRNTHRDRLQSGVQAGVEYPLSGKMQTLRHVFFAESDEYLFEARTMVVGMPAAVSAIRIYEAPERLPRLAVKLPEGLEGRHFGNFDEDQTIDTSLPRQNTTNVLLDYMDYTGQDIFQYAVLRYTLTFMPYEGSFQMNLYPFGRFDHLVAALEKRGIRFVGWANMFNIPDFMSRIWADYYKKKGMLLYNNKGAYSKDWNGLPYPDISSPEVQELLIRHFEDFANMLGKNFNFDGFDIGPLFFWDSPESGYGPDTLARFTRDTGIKVPSGAEKAYQFLMGKKKREWLDWRVKISTEAVRKLAERIWKINPEFKLYVQEPDSASAGRELCYETGDFEGYGYDWNKLRKIGKNIGLMQRRDSAYLRAMMHYGRKITNFEDSTNAKTNGTLARYGHSIDLMKNFINYYETRATSLMPKKYATYFQDSDCKPHGRFYLKDMALSLAYSDALSYIHGGQPFGSWGREEYAREFARAYRALPRMPFKQEKGISDPVTVRYCSTKNGTYFYAVNICPFDVTATLGGVPDKVQELSSGKELDGTKIALKPYELRSFLIASDKNAKVVCTGIETPEADKYYVEQLNELNKGIAQLMNVGDFSKEAAMVKEIANCIGKKEYAEAHRRIFSQPVRNLSRKYTNLAKVSAEVASIKSGRIAINCGSEEYYTAPDGRLFFPDRAYGGVNAFGALPGTLNCIRAARGLGATDAPGLFATEAYDCPGYKFNLPNGKYHIKLYMKWGFTGGYKEGVTSLTCKIQGRNIFEKMDFYKLSSDFNKPQCFEADAEVSNGILSIEFINEGKTHPTTRLCNGIEITPVK